MDRHALVGSLSDVGRWVVNFSLVAMLAGCAAMEREEVQQTEGLLAAAGFRIKVAATPAKRLQLQSLTQHRLIRRLHNGRIMYVYADAMDCKCFYFGTQVEYDKYRNLALRQQIAQERLNAAEMNENAAMDWGAWGPWGPWY